LVFSEVFGIFFNKLLWPDPSTSPVRETADVMTAWLCELNEQPKDPVFPSIRGGFLSRDAIERLVARHCKTAQLHCPSLRHKKVTPHVFRHTAAMELLHHGVDRSVIALWLGHESIETTKSFNCVPSKFW